MTTRLRRWQERARLFIGHVVSRPSHHLFNLVPQWEIGLAEAQVSRLTVAHSPLAGRRAVQISDLHLDRYRPRHDSIVRTIAGLRPDWIFITGDLLNVPDGLPHLFRFLSQLRAVAPVYMTLGNHDHYSGVPVDRFAELADRHKLSLLVNQTAFVAAGSGELAIVGVDDPSLHRANLRCLPPPSKGRFILLLAHAPNILDQIQPHHRIDLALCGHSHGGQWRVPLIPPVWLPPGCNGHLHGVYVRNGLRLYVNRGLGWSVLPARWNCPPEILLLEWTSGKAEY